MDEAFLERLRDIFRAEARDHVSDLREGLRELEANGASGPSAALDKAFRAAHSLKGAARAVNEADVEARGQDLENRLAALKKGRGVEAGSADLHVALEALVASLEEAGIFVEVEPPALLRDAAAPAAVLPAAPPNTPPAGSAAASGKAAPAPAHHEKAPDARRPKEAPRAQAGTDSLIRIPVARVEALVEESEGLVTAKTALADLAAGLRALAVDAAEARADRERALAAGAEDPTLAALSPLTNRLESLARRAARDRDALSALADRLSEAATGILLFPLSQVLDLVPHMARDVAEACGKQVVARVEGGGILADRRVLEGLKDILIQLVRNAVDHGIEDPEARVRAGKPRAGRLEVAAFLREGNKVEVVVRDDGRGLDEEALRSAGVREGLVEAGAAGTLSPAEVHALAFRGGLTTRTEATAISGRGFGLSVVAERLERMGGSVTLESRPLRGATFRLALPQAMAHFRGLLVREGGANYYLPAAQVERVLEVEQDALREVEGRSYLVMPDGPIPLARLGTVLGAPARSGPDAGPAVLASAGARRTALQVDEIVGEEEILVKNMGPMLRRIRHYAGAALAPTGEAVPVLNVADLVATALAVRPEARAPDAGPARAKAKRKVLVVEDSITSRTLLRGVLEASGYAVSVAVDGQEAWEALERETFDVVVSDVEMPRMDGFDLARRVKGEPRLAGLPFVLVTSQEDPADRERGRSAGADAFVVKRTLDTGNLLEILGRMLA